MTTDWTALAAGGFAGDAAPFGVHPNDRERAIEYFATAKRAGLGWADVRAQLVAHMEARDFAEDAIEDNLGYAEALWPSVAATSPVYHLLSGGFAHMSAPFAVHGHDQRRAAEYRREALAAGLAWADIEADVYAYADEQGWTAAERQKQLGLVSKFFKGRLCG